MSVFVCVGLTAAGGETGAAGGGAGSVAGGLPVGDPQFWVVTVVAVLAIVVLVRALVPRRGRGVRTTLTVGGTPSGSRRRRSSGL